MKADESLAAASESDELKQGDNAKRGRELHSASACNLAGPAQGSRDDSSRGYRTAADVHLQARLALGE